MFKEKIGDVSGARALFLQRDMDLASNLVETVYREANMEKRMVQDSCNYYYFLRDGIVSTNKCHHTPAGEH